MTVMICITVRLLCLFGADALPEAEAAAVEDAQLVALLLELSLGPVSTPSESEQPPAQAEQPPEASAEAALPDVPASEPAEPEPEPEPDADAEQEPGAETSLWADCLTQELFTFKNNTEYSFDASQLLAAPLPFEHGAAVLIVHTHGSEAYTPAGDDIYTESDPARTEDCDFNVVRVGDELAAELEARGISVIHDRELYDYPSYAGSYGRSLTAVEEYMSAHPEIGLVIDLHRDAMEAADGTPLATTYASPEGESAQVMLVMGTGADGLSHPDWQTNLSLAAKLQCLMNGMYPGLARPVSIRGERFNQQVCGGALLVEVGMHGNTLEQALTAVRLFADCTAELFLM